MWFHLFLLSLLAGLRDITIGIDTRAYLDLYQYIADGNADYIEPGWILLNRFVQIIGGNFSGLLWLVSCLTLIPIGIVCQRFCTNPSLGLFFYYSLYAYLHTFNGMRQFLAISFVLLAYSAWYKHSIKSFVLFIGIAVAFHFSAILSIVVILLKYIHLKSLKYVLGALLASLFGGIFFNDNLLAFVMGPYAHYLESATFGYRENMFSAFLFVLLADFFFIFIWYTGDKEFKEYWWLKVFWIGIILMNLTFQLVLGTRIILYFNLVQILVYPMYFLHNRFKNKGVPYAIVFTYVGVLFMKILLLGNIAGEVGSVFPYKWIL